MDYEPKFGGFTETFQNDLFHYRKSKSLEECFHSYQDIGNRDFL